MSLSAGIMVYDRLDKVLSTRLDISHSKTQPGRKGGTITLLESLQDRGICSGEADRCGSGIVRDRGNFYGWTCGRGGYGLFSQILVCFLLCIIALGLQTPLPPIHLLLCDFACQLDAMLTSQALIPLCQRQ